MNMEDMYKYIPTTNMNVNFWTKTLEVQRLFLPKIMMRMKPYLLDAKETEERSFRKSKVLNFQLKNIWINGATVDTSW